MGGPVAHDALAESYRAEDPSELTNRTRPSGSRAAASAVRQRDRLSRCCSTSCCLGRRAPRTALQTKAQPTSSTLPSRSRVSRWVRGRAKSAVAIQESVAGSYTSADRCPTSGTTSPPTLTPNRRATAWRSGYTSAPVQERSGSMTRRLGRKAGCCASEVVTSTRPSGSSVAVLGEWTGSVALHEPLPGS